MDFNKLQKINAELAAMSTPYQKGGKIYVEVAKRLQGFWSLYPNGRILTRWFELTDDHAVCIAEVYDGDTLITTGTAREDKGAGFVNKTSYIENAETSAVGRALGILGIGSVDSVASYDEVQQATATAKPAKADKAGHTVRAEFVAVCKSFGLLPGEQARKFKLNNDSPDEDFRAAIMIIEEQNRGAK